MKNWLTGTVLSIGLVLSQGVSALPMYLEGDVSYSGVFSLDDGATNFLDSENIYIDNALVIEATDTFAAFGMSIASPLTHDSPIGLDSSTAPHVDLWSFDILEGGFVTFDLMSYDIIERGAQFLNLTGSGVFDAPGFSETPGTWSFSANLSTGQVSASYSASSITAVPAPGPLALLALGLLGIGVLRRRTASA